MSYIDRMISDDDEAYIREIERRDREAHREEWRAADRRRAREQEISGLSSAELADQLGGVLEPQAPHDISALADCLSRQAHILDKMFFTALHQAGYGYEHNLHLQPLQAALTAQRQCRQTFDTLKDLHKAKPGKQKEGPRK